MENPEKLTTLGAQDTRSDKQNKKHNSESQTDKPRSKVHIICNLCIFVLFMILIEYVCVFIVLIS